jgi:protein transport protein SEC61 subunit alpha
VTSAVSLFVAANSCERIIWEAFSPLKVNGEYQGAILYLLSAFFSPNKLHSLFRAFFRQEGSNVLNVISTVLMFALIVYVQVSGIINCLMRE